MFVLDCFRFVKWLDGVCGVFCGGGCGCPAMNLFVLLRGINKCDKFIGPGLQTILYGPGP